MAVDLAEALQGRLELSRDRILRGDRDCVFLIDMRQWGAGSDSTRVSDSPGHGTPAFALANEAAAEEGAVACYERMRPELKQVPWASWELKQVDHQCPGQAGTRAIGELVNDAPPQTINGGKGGCNERRGGDHRTAETQSAPHAMAVKGGADNPTPSNLHPPSTLHSPSTLHPPSSLHPPSIWS
jgi:hypothetical protein